ncbi:MAG: YkgJ family cysteine cluster protein [Methanobacteriota archaeon]|nr:MAG: YkgJ family cysteine cluster protein [Euryarchaeota archaeon]
MKRNCPYCGVRLKGKEMADHIYRAHQGGGAEFFCREGCVRCCTDRGAPLELLIEDVRRIVPALKTTYEDFFKDHAGILWSSIPGTRAFIPSIGLPFPCSFLKEGRCSIYEIRPLHCRLFPERLYVNPSPQELEPFYRAGYVCVDEGFTLKDGREEEIKRLMEEDQRRLVETADFFKNEDFIYELTPEEYEEAQRAFRKIDIRDPERNRKKREVIEGLIPEEVKERVKEAFLSRLKALG